MGLREVTPALRNPLTGEGELMIGGASGAPSRLARPDYDRTLRRSGSTLVFGRTKEAYLNDRADIDATGTDDMGATISTYLSEFAANGVTRVYCEQGSAYSVGSTIDVPASTTLIGSGAQQGAAASMKATFRARADDVTMFELTGNYAVLSGLNIHLNSKANAVGVRPNRHRQIIENCLFGGCAATGTGVKGGGILYFVMRENVFSDSWLGRSVDLLDAYADNPAIVYYGVNVGWFERNMFAGREGAFRAEGLFTVRDNDFEGGSGYTGPALEVSTASATSKVVLDGNYFEMTNSSKGILLGTGSMGVVSGNVLYGVQASVGGYGLSCGGYVYGLNVTGNSFNRFETGIALNTGVTDSNWPSLILDANAFNSCTTNVSGGPTGQQAGSSNTTSNRATALVHRGDGRITHQGAIVGGCIYWADAYGLVLDLKRGNVFTLDMTTGGTLTHTNAGYGQRFALHFKKGTVTLADATWNLASGVDETPPAGTVKAFIVDYDGLVREVGPLA